MCATYESSVVKTWEDALIKPIIVAGNGSGSDPDVFANVLHNLFGMKKAKLISGYPGTAEISLAMERGEVDGRCGWSWTSIKAEKAAWLAEKKLNLILQLALEKARDLPNVPLIVDKAQTEAQRQILKLIFSRQTMGRPFVAPPAIPADRRDALRAAFDQTKKNAGCLADAEKSKIEINPVGGAAIDALVKDLYRTPRRSCTGAQGGRERALRFILEKADQYDVRKSLTKAAKALQRSRRRAQAESQCRGSSC